MKTNALHFGFLLLRIGFSAAMLTHGYGKFMKVLAGDFSFGDPIGIGPTASLILCAIAEFIAPIFPAHLNLTALIALESKHLVHIFPSRHAIEAGQNNLKL
mgnify:CR=1 FL=1